MSETQTENVAEATNESTEGETQGEQTETESTDVFDREYVENLRKESAKYRTAAKESSERLAEVEQQLTELTEKHTETEKSVETAQLEVTRWKVAAKHGVSEEDVELFLTASDEETLEKQAQRISQHSGRAPKPDAGQGNRSGKGKLTPAEEFAEAWNSALKT